MCTSTAEVAQEMLGRGEKASVFVPGAKPSQRMQTMPLLFPILRCARRLKEKLNLCRI